MSGARFWLTSDRLALRQFTPDDIDWLADLYSDPDVTRYLGGVKDRAKSEELLGTRILQYYDEHPGLGICWKPPFASTSRSPTNGRRPLSGRKRLTRSS